MSPPMPSENEMKKNPFLLSLHIQALSQVADANGVEAWRRAEFSRIRVLVLDARLDQTVH